MTDRIWDRVVCKVVSSREAHTSRWAMQCPCGGESWWPSAIEEGIGGRRIWSAPSHYPSDELACKKCGAVMQQRQKRSAIWKMPDVEFRNLVSKSTFDTYDAKRPRKA